MSKSKKNPHIGSTLTAFLEEEGILEQATTAATKSVLAWRISEEEEDAACQQNVEGEA